MATIERRGSAWRARVRLKGQLLTKTSDTEEEARTWAETIERRLTNGHTAEQIRTSPQSMTISALFDRYAHEVSKTKGGARWERLRLLLIGRQLPERVLDLDGAALAEWRNERLKKVSASTVNRELNLISAVLTHAIKEWRLPLAVNPAHNIKWPKKPAPRKRRVPDAERAAIIQHLGWDGVSAPTLTKHWVAWAFVFALETMMRQGEILNLTWGHVHARHCHLPKTKNGHSRDVPLSRAAVSLLTLAQRGPDGNRVVPVEGGTLGVYFRCACKDAGITDLHFHDARREALTRASKKITNVAELARASGHRGIASLMIYYQPSIEDMADKLDG
jgi:integrase